MSTTTIISNGAAPHHAAPVPIPLGDDTAATGDFIVQSGGILRFDSAGVLTVHGSGRSTNNGSIYLGTGILIFYGHLAFLNGGSFQADTGTILFSGDSLLNNPGSIFNSGLSTVIFNGSSDQVLLAQEAMGFYDVEFRTAGTLALTGAVTISNDAYVAEGCTVYIPLGSSLSVEGNLDGPGVITGEGDLNGSPLPVQLTTMVARAAGRDVRVEWETATEINNYGFEVERRPVSGPGIVIQSAEWLKIGFVPGGGTTAGRREYRYEDSNVAPGRYAYRIRQIDTDGSYSYTAAVEVEVGQAPRELVLAQNFPNPFNPITAIEFTLERDGPAMLRVFDVVGREIETLLDQELRGGVRHRAMFDGSKYTSGVYFCRLESGGKVLMRRMVLMK